MNGQVLSEALRIYGVKSQKEKLYEELAELQEALYKYRDGKVAIEAVVTELADVTVMLMQMRMCYGSEEQTKSHERLLESISRHYDSLVDLYVYEAASVVLALHSPDGEVAGRSVELIVEELRYTVSYIAYNLGCAVSVIGEIETKVDRLANRMKTMKNNG